MKHKKLSIFYSISKYFIVILFFLSIPLQIVKVQQSKYMSDGYVILQTKMDKEKCNEAYDENVCSKDLEPGKYFFNDNDLQQIEKMQGVTAVYGSVFDNHTKNSDNSEQFINSITTLNLDDVELITESSFLNINASDEVNYKFESLKFPFEFLKQTGNINETYDATNLINGEIVENTSKFEPIILPKELAEYFSVSEGELVELPVSVYSDEGTSEEMKYYFVAGIYDDSSLPIDRQNIIYVKYADMSEYEINDQLIFDKTKSIYGDIDEHKKYLTNENNFNSLNAPYYDEIHILTEDVDSTVRNIENKYPNQTIVTKSSVDEKINGYIFPFKIIVILLGLILFLLNMLNVRSIYEVDYRKDESSHINIIFELIALYIIMQYMEKFILNFLYNYEYIIDINTAVIYILFTLIIFFPYIILKIVKIKDSKHVNNDENNKENYNDIENNNETKENNKRRR